MKTRHYIQIYSLFFITWFIFSLLFSQVIPYMTFLGFTEIQRSWVWTISAIIGIIVQLIVGYFSDKNRKIKGYFLKSLILLVVLSTIGYYQFESRISFYFICISLFVALFKVSSNLIETWTIQINNEVMERFGFIRIFGSLGWAVGSIVVAKVIESKGFHSIPLWLLMSGLIALVLLSDLPDSQKVGHPINLKMSDVKELFSNRQYVLSVIIFFILFIVYAMDSLTVIDKMMEINSTQEQIGWRWSIQAFVELPLMIYGIYFIQRFSVRKIVAITAFVMGSRYILYGLSTMPSQIIFISLLQAITYPFMLLTQKVLVNEFTPLHLRASGHLVMTAITSNIPIILVPLLNSFLHQYFSFSFILVIGGLLCLIPLSLTLRLERV